MAGECHALLTYGVAGLVGAVRVEVDWDTRDSPGGFQADDQLDCAPPLPEDLDDPVPCQADSPVFDQPGTAQVAIRVTDTVDGTQATAAQPLVVTAPRGSKVTVPGRRGSTAGPVRAEPARRAVRPRQRAQDLGRRRRRSRTPDGPR